MASWDDPPTEDCARCGSPVPPGADFCRQCGLQVGRSTPSAPLLSSASEQPSADPGWPHFLRYLGYTFAVGFATMLCGAGYFWLAYVLKRTGHRRRDVLLALVPILGAIVATRATWRYTARSVYWTPRPGYPSEVASGGQRTAAIAAGWVLLPVYVLGIVAIAALGEPTSDEWTTDVQQEWIREFEAQGVDRSTAECLLSQLRAEYPEGPPGDEVSDADFEAALIGAAEVCVE